MTDPIELLEAAYTDVSPPESVIGPILDQLAMEPFEELNPTCPKCAGETRIVYHDVSYRSEYGCAAVKMLRTSFPPEHHCVTCQRCRYQWPMQVQPTDGPYSTVPYSSEDQNERTEP